jgi:hypothetical protein
LQRLRPSRGLLHVSRTGRGAALQPVRGRPS